jgi:hypothetical protein
MTVLSDRSIRSDIDHKGHSAMRCHPAQEFCNSSRRHSTQREREVLALLAEGERDVDPTLPMGLGRTRGNTLQIDGRGSGIATTNPTGGQGSAMAWMVALAELRNRSVQDVCVAACDRLKGPRVLVHLS